MSRPTLAELRALDGARVRLTIPKPREDQRLVGEISVDGDRVVLHVETGGVDAGPDHETVELRGRERDGVVQAYRGVDADVLVGRVKRVDRLGG